MEAAIAVRNKDGVIKAEAKALKTGEVIFAWEGEYEPGDQIVCTFPKTNAFYVVRIDHRYDSAIYMGTALKERKLSVIKSALEEYKDLARLNAGPAVVETFGEAGFTPINKKEALLLSRHQIGRAHV